jgi:hypothetical protein
LSAGRPDRPVRRENEEAITLVVIGADVHQATHTLVAVFWTPNLD